MSEPTTNRRHNPPPPPATRFPPPKIFTNALLANHDITSLIRDTEAHERALFSVPPPPPPASAPPEPASSKTGSSSSRRQTVFNVASGEVTTAPATGGVGVGGGAPRRHTAVAAVLGGDLHEQIRRSERRRGDDVDVELLLRSAEKLCGVYPLPGAPERIPALRTRLAHSRDTLAYYEARVAEQAEALGRMNRGDHWRDEEEEEEDGAVEDDGDADAVGDVTEEDLVTEEEEVRDLERKKRELQDRLRAMEKDLGGLMNM